MEIHPFKVVFFYAKNGPCDASVATYLDKIANVIGEKDSRTVPPALLSVIFGRMCHQVCSKNSKMSSSAPQTRIKGAALLVV